MTLTVDQTGQAALLTRPSNEATPAEPFGDSRQQLLAAIAYVDLRVRWAVDRARVHGLDPNDEFRGLYISEEQIDKLLGHELGDLWPDSNGSAPVLSEWPAALAEARHRWQARSDSSREHGISF